jgi:hypothetical protein
MTHSVGVYVSLETSRICIVDQSGRVVRELTAKTEPEVLAMALLDTGLAFARIVLEAGPPVPMASCRAHTSGAAGRAY